MGRLGRTKLSISVDGHDVTVRCRAHDVDPFARLKVYVIRIPFNVLLSKTEDKSSSIVHRFSVFEGTVNIVRVHSPLAHPVHGVISHGVHAIHAGSLGTSNVKSTGVHLGKGIGEREHFLFTILFVRTSHHRSQAAHVFLLSLCFSKTLGVLDWVRVLTHQRILLRLLRIILLK